MLNPQFNQWKKEVIDNGRNNLTVKNHCTGEKPGERSLEFNLESWKDKIINMKAPFITTPVNKLQTEVKYG